MKQILFYLLFLFSLNVVFAKDSQSPAQSVPQKRADTPKDQAIQVKIHDGRTYCYSPNFTKGFGYVLLSDCSYATPARYDVFQRISWNVNGTWMCLSAPSSVTGIGGKSTQQWDWLLVEPCSLNDENQRWVIKDRGLHTANGKFRVKDYEWYAIISKKPSDHYDHDLKVDAMKTWIDTIAIPGSIATKTFVGWTFVSQTPPQFAVYYLQNDQSFKDDVKQLFYNPENGHIAQFDYANGLMYCMTSKQAKGKDWNWVAWEACTDAIPQSKDNKYWEFFSLNDNEGALRDKDGNFLRIAQYGPHWGVPYTAKPEYLEKDTTNAPKSLFVFDKYIDMWNRYVDSNLGDSLQFCPAPGSKQANFSSNEISESSHKREVRSLPPSFKITDDWIRRFWEISVTTQQASPSHISICGICLLHSFQIVAELQENYIRGPLRSGGYFFDTAVGADPFVSFRQRFPILAERLEGTMNWVNTPLRAGEDISTRTTRINYAVALTMLPGYQIIPVRHETQLSEIRTMIDNMFASPVGTIGIAGFLRMTPSGVGGHAQPVLRTEEGLLFIPTNTPNMSYDDFRSYFASSTFADTSAVIDFLTNSQPQNLLGFMFLSIDRYFANPINLYLSNNNCTGLGDDRRGNSGSPSSSSVNQCGLGRCAIQ